ncbi:unnamed protein product [Vitrella brassicaformis CCMP3155]|uniref:Uncharacterized protein n=1 Tax=Vitrella brassicaformis (strain CCMP3155) TaxID=1169540 RepID=A0A0G4GUD2_VITBC|nr:unnamed protein product [Vitrella brassicaformis CCMP3155]|eukprot:CEM34417.1 unnamed protein product [Vitrella brassicaformis CCMP3155]
MCPELLFPCPYCTPVKRMPETLLALPLAEETVALGMGLVEDEAYTCGSFVGHLLWPDWERTEPPVDINIYIRGAYGVAAMTAVPSVLQKPFRLYQGVTLPKTLWTDLRLLQDRIRQAYRLRFGEEPPNHPHQHHHYPYHHHPAAAAAAAAVAAGHHGGGGGLRPTPKTRTEG